MRFMRLNADFTLTRPDAPKGLRSSLQFSTRAILILYASYLCSVKYPATVSRLFIDFVDNPDSVDDSIDNPKCPIIRRLFDASYLANLSPNEQARKILDILHSTMLEVANRRNWPAPPLMAAYAACEQANLVYSGFVKGITVRSPNKCRKARVWYRMDADWFYLFLYVYRSGHKCPDKYLVMQWRPFLFYLTRQILKQVKWKSNSRIAVIAGPSFMYEEWSINISM